MILKVIVRNKMEININIDDKKDVQVLFQVVILSN